MLEVLRQVREAEPPRPSSVSPGLDRDLETICLKCLDKDPAQRYASAEALADDLERWLNGEPIEARPVGQAERLWRWCRRNRAVAALSFALIFVFVASFVAVFAQWRQALEERDEKEKARKEATRREGEAVQARLEATRSTAQVREVLGRMRARQYFVVKAGMNPGLAGSVGLSNRLVKLEYEELGGLRRPSSCLATFPNGEVATGAVDGKIRVWASSRGRDPERVYSTEGMVIGLAVAREGVWYSVSATGRFAAYGYGTGGNPRYDLHDTISCAVFDREASSLAVGTGAGRIKLWQLQAHVPSGKLPAPRLIRTLEESHGPIICMALEPGGRWLACAGGLELEETAISLWDVMTDRRIARLRGHTGAVTCLAFSPDGKLLASGGYDGSVRVWDLPGGKPVRVLGGKREWVTSLLFSPNGELILSGSSTGAIEIWGLQSDNPLLFPAHSDVVTGLATRPGKGFYSTALDGITRKWDIDLTETAVENLKKRLGEAAAEVWEVVSESM
jgi:hypothetical protein